MVVNFFLCKVTYDKMQEDGTQKPEKEVYLVHAFSFTEAEGRIIEEVKQYIRGEFEVTNIRKMNVWDLYDFGDGDRWYRCKVYLKDFDEEKQVETRKAVAILAHAGSVREAYDVVVKGMSGTLISNYEIHSVVETDIMDVLKDVAPVATKTEA
ncbi:MAG: DUF4494 domain-containing protein [Paludibacteraceae bacterium]|nr:DUF4494 domain-containing protein [Paludibacteraceae bacterium]